MASTDQILEPKSTFVKKKKKRERIGEEGCKE